MKTYSRVYAEIDLNAILHNMAQMQSRISKETKIMSVIKTDGYGHGAVPIGRELESLAVTWGLCNCYHRGSANFAQKWIAETNSGIGCSFSRTI